MKTEIDFLTTKTPEGYNVYKAVSDAAKKVYEQKCSIVYDGWFIQSNFQKTHPDFSYQFVDPSQLPEINKSI